MWPLSGRITTPYLYPTALRGGAREMGKKKQPALKGRNESACHVRPGTAGTYVAYSLLTAQQCQKAIRRI
jgi:hypothetical protein